MSRSRPESTSRTPASVPAPRPGVRAVLREREYAGLLLARLLSDWGDHVARVALGAFVLERTGSALWSAAVFGVSYLPGVVGQAMLSPLADRLPRRALLVACDVLRAALVAVLLLVLAVTGAPLAAVLVLVFLIELAGTPFYAANQALVSDIFPDRTTFLTAASWLRMLGQANQVVGLAVGGAVVALLEVTGALWLDLTSYLLSAVLLRVLIRHRPPAGPRAEGTLRSLARDVREGAGHVARDVPMRSLLLLALGMTVVLVAPEAVALPYARSVGAGSATGGLLLAAVPLGAVVGVAVVSRWAPLTQVRRMLPMAGLATLPLLAMALQPPWPVAAALFVVTGACQGFMAPLLATYTALAPESLTGRVNGLAASAFALLTALAWPLVGALADLVGPGQAAALSGLGGAAVLVALRLRWPGAAVDEAARRTYAARD